MDRQEKESRGLNLLKRSKRGFWRMVFSRTGVVTVLLLLQIAVFLLALLRFEEFQTQMLGGSVLIGAAMTVRKSKRGKVYYSCSGYPDCKFMSWDIPTGDKCPDCGTALVKAPRGGVKCSNKD